MHVISANEGEVPGTAAQSHRIANHLVILAAEPEQKKSPDARHIMACGLLSERRSLSFHCSRLFFSPCEGIFLPFLRREK